MSNIHRSAEWAALTRRVRPRFKELVDAGAAVCCDCGKPILPGQSFAVGHILAASLYPELALAEFNLAPTHHGKSNRKNCNQVEGGRLGAAKTNARHRRATGSEYPTWHHD